MVRVLRDSGQEMSTTAYGGPLALFNGQRR